MLTFLMGADPYAKLCAVNDRLLAAAKSGKQAFLLVPEQSSFERERDLLFRFGERDANRIRVVNFTHFSKEILLSHGQSVKSDADEAAKAVVMSLALYSLRDTIRIYRRHYDRAQGIAQLISFCEELTRAGITPEMLSSAAKRQNGQLKDKLEELSLIAAAYDGLLSERFSAATDNLLRAAMLIEDEGLFRDAVFYVDDFRGFTALQLRFLAAVNRNAELCVSLIGDGGDEETPLTFEHAIKNRRRLTRLSGGEAKIETVGAAFAPETPGTAVRDLFLPTASPKEGTDSGVTIAGAENLYDESAWIAYEIRRLLESGMRAKDIAVYYRKKALVRPVTAALRAAGIPVYEDKRRPLSAYPLVRLMLSAAEIAANGFSSQTVFALLKTGLTGRSLTEIAELENYVFRWQLDGGAWIKPFKMHPKGFNNTFDDEANEALKRLNALREEIVFPLLRLKEKLSAGDIRGSCAGLYDYLLAVDAQAHFLAYAKELNESGDETGAKDCERVWDAGMDALDALNAACAGQNVPPAYFCALLRLILSGSGLGEIPAGIDEIVIGQLDRTRFLAPKAVFVAGMQAGVLPKSLSDGGVLSHREMRRLSGENWALDALPEDQYEEERLIAYRTLISATKRLYLSYSRAEITGEKLEPSPLLQQLKALRPAVPTVDCSALSPEERVISPAVGLRILGERQAERSVFAVSLEKALTGDPQTARHVSALHAAVAGLPDEIGSRDTAKKLFGEAIATSASKLERYAECPFSYFCQYGLQISKLHRERLDARIYGLLVHAALDQVVMHYRLPELDDRALRAAGDAAAKQYADEYLGGEKQLSPAVQRAVARAKNEIFEILKRLRSEFAVSLFHPVDTELGVGMQGGIPAYRLKLPDGGEMRLTGKIDRVDTMETDEGAYVRVIDYKTGGKDFQLSDVYEGFNLQMLLYLFALCDNGFKRYGKLLPAGVLYVPANARGENVGRRANDDDVTKMKLKNGRMNGVILSEESVVRGMEPEAKGIYIDAQITSDGKLKGNFLSLTEFSLLHRRIDDYLAGTGMRLHRGEIPAVPALFDSGKSACDYCDYKNVCLKEPGERVRDILRLPHEKARLKLYDNGEEDTNG
ncbi:MAG: PD-(D/E)XK nuclease family protein [Clostridia bacterium]|nr:PD-(D/E)XK nuclease family protein [Clostridia bacterium]